MGAFLENFLRHEFSIWKELFASPFMVPTTLVALYWMQKDKELTSWIDYYRRILLVFLWFCFCTFVASLLMCLIGTHVSTSAVLAGYGLFLHFGLPEARVVSLLQRSNFYDHAYAGFYIFFVMTVPLKSETPLALIFSLALGLFAATLCLGFAFGIQQLILSISWDRWRAQPQDVPAIANFSVTLAFSLWILLLLSIQPLSVAFQRLKSASDSDILEPAWTHPRPNRVYATF